MYSLRPWLILSLLLLIGGCGERSGVANGSTSNTAEEANANRSVEPGLDGAKDNAEELGGLIKLPFEPEDLVWKELNDPKQGRHLIAVFQFTPADTKKVIENASRFRPPARSTLSTEKWFPKELVTQNELANDEGIPATSYAADDFYQPPYTEGSLSHVDNTDFFVLEVSAK